MKNIINQITISLFSALVLFSCSTSILSTDINMQKHTNVIKYIENNKLIKDFLKKQKIAINKENKIDLAASPDVHYVDLVSFVSFIEKNKLSNLDIGGYKTNLKENIFDSLLTLDNKLKFESYLDDNLEMLSTDKQSKFIIFFSKAFDNLLGVRFIWDRNFERNLLEISYDNPSIEFLFVFNENNEIEHVLYEEFWP